MKFISHRGNICGRNICEENNPLYIEKALNMDFDVEIDVWFGDNSWFLGHDKPEHKISLNFLNNNRLWCHAKNHNALNYLINNNIHCFWHQEDLYTLTSYGYIWAYPDFSYPINSIAVLPENNKLTYDSINHCSGICSDYIYFYRQMSINQPS